MHKTFFIYLFLPLFFALTINSSELHAQKAKRQALWKSLNTPANADTTGDDYYGDNTLRFEDHVYKKNIKTVELRDETFLLSKALINLESQEKLKLSFDDLDGGYKNYFYTIVQCNADWEPSDLMTNEYIDGFIENSVTDYHASFNTLQKYTHYSFDFPNNSMRILKSGNYIVKVYLDSNPENLVITRRFMVFQNKVAIDSRVTAASITEDRDFKHEIDFTIDHTGYTINNPYGDLKIVLTQNNRWDNAKTNLKPVYVKDQQLVYDYDQENVFDGGNEFRHFDTRSIRYHGERVSNINTDSSGIHVELGMDEKRSFKRYYSQPDMNGDFTIKVQEGTNSDVEADYCYVTFFLPYDDIMKEGNLYVFGEYNAWQCNNENLMH
ncbi:MAG: type IX secretion system plug protein, partial [Bacteroidia bacterium]